LLSLELFNVIAALSPITAFVDDAELFAGLFVALLLLLLL
jgi:hypothetical protein